MKDIIILLIIIGIIVFYVNTNKRSEHFFPFNLPEYSGIPYYHDIRGPPNLLYTRSFYGMYEPVGFYFSPYLYDLQGNYVKIL